MKKKNILVKIFVSMIWNYFKFKTYKNKEINEIIFINLHRESTTEIVGEIELKLIKIIYKSTLIFLI